MKSQKSLYTLIPGNTTHILMYTLNRLQVTLYEMELRVLSRISR